LRRSSLVSVRADLTREEAVAHDLASALVSGRILPELTYQQAVDLFGEEGTAEFIYLVGLYCMVSVTLNGFDVAIPAPTKKLDGRSGYFDLFCARPTIVIRSPPCSTDDAAEAGHLGFTISLSVGNWIAFLGHEIPYERPLCAKSGRSRMLV
jgi:hypothetical protein